MITTSHHGIGNKITMLLWGPPGVGKTHIARTLPSPFLINVERGNAALIDAPAMPMLTVNQWADVFEAYSWLTDTEEGRAVESVVIDSGSELADMLLLEKKGSNRNGLAAFGEMHDEFLGFLRALRSLDRHLIVIARMSREQSDEGLIAQPSFPSTTLRTQVPHMVDMSVAMRLIRDPQTKEVNRWLQLQGDPAYAAKSRFDFFKPFEAPDLGALITTVAARVDAFNTTTKNLSGEDHAV